LAVADLGDDAAGWRGTSSGRLDLTITDLRHDCTTWGRFAGGRSASGRSTGFRAAWGRGRAARSRAARSRAIWGRSRAA